MSLKTRTEVAFLFLSGVQSNLDTALVSAFLRFLVGVLMKSLYL